MWSVPKQVSPLLQRQQARTSGICSRFPPHIFLSISFAHSITAVSHFFLFFISLADLLTLSDTNCPPSFVFDLSSISQMTLTWRARISLALMRVSQWVFSGSQWETAAYQEMLAGNQGSNNLTYPRPHLSECMPLKWANTSTCLCALVYTSLSDVRLLQSKGSWLRSHGLVCHLALFDQKEAVKHKVKAHLLPLLTHTACLLLLGPPSTHIKTPKHWDVALATKPQPAPGHARCASCYIKLLLRTCRQTETAI